MAVRENNLEGFTEDSRPGLPLRAQGGGTGQQISGVAGVRVGIRVGGRHGLIRGNTGAAGPGLGRKGTGRRPLDLPRRQM